MVKCNGITRDGGRCEGVAIPGSDYCYAHDPAKAEERRRNAQRAARGAVGGGPPPSSTGSRSASRTSPRRS